MTFSDIKQGEIVSGMIVGVNDRDVLVDVGFKSEGIISVNEFKETPIVGGKIEAVSYTHLTLPTIYSV